MLNLYIVRMRQHCNWNFLWMNNYLFYMVITCVCRNCQYKNTREHYDCCFILAWNLKTAQIFADLNRISTVDPILTDSYKLNIVWMISDDCCNWLWHYSFYWLHMCLSCLHNESNLIWIPFSFVYYFDDVRAKRKKCENYW